MRVLFVSPYVPSPVRIRPYGWIRALARLGHEVHVVAVRPPEDRSAEVADLRGVVRALDVFPLSRVRTLANAVRALPTRQPFQASYAAHPQARAQVAALAATGEFDIVHIEHLRGVPLAHGVAGAPCVWDAVDSITALFERAARLAPTRSQRWVARLDLARTRRFEATAPSRFARVIVTTPPEADAFAALAGPASMSRLAIVPNGVDTEHFGTVDARDGTAVLFSGKLSYHANVSAALRLIERIMPLVWARCPGVPVVLAGKDPSPRLLALASDPRITVTGYLEDLRPVFARAAVAVCPLVYGAGIQNKVLEAMASGVPVVASRELDGTIKARAGEAWLLGADDRQVADHVVDLLDHPHRRHTVGDAGRAFVTQHHAWTAQARRLVEVYDGAREEWRGPRDARGRQACA
jgi:glycosyltransferase involved in cell wall biosynthesis